MVPRLKRARPAEQTAGPALGQRPITGDWLVLRNYDDERHAVTVRLSDADDEVVYRQRYVLSPRSRTTVSLSLDRALYDVTVRTTEETAQSTCVVGDRWGETALVEIGNGLVSVTEAAF